MEQNDCEKIAKNLDFVVVRESTEAADHGCSGIKLQESTSGGVLI